MLSEILIRDYRAEKKIAVDEWIASGKQFHVNSKYFMFGIASCVPPHMPPLMA
jgi:hypothetical protein